MPTLMSTSLACHTTAGVCACPARMACRAMIPPQARCHLPPFHPTRKQAIVGEMLKLMCNPHAGQHARYVVVKLGDPVNGNGGLGPTRPRHDLTVVTLQAHAPLEPMPRAQPAQSLPPPPRPRPTHVTRLVFACHESLPARRRSGGKFQAPSGYSTCISISAWKIWSREGPRRARG